MRIEPMRPARRAPADIAVNLPLMRLFSEDTFPPLSVVFPSPTAATAASDTDRRHRAAVSLPRRTAPKERSDSIAFRPVSTGEVGVA